jgi:hypothetical protein
MDLAKRVQRPIRLEQGDVTVRPRSLAATR